MTEQAPDGELVIVTEAGKFTGWTSVDVRRSVEGFPSSFTISGTTLAPGSESAAVPLNSPIQLLIGGQVVLTGYVERSVVTVGPANHTVTFLGRGRCCDLADTSALIDGQTRQLGDVVSLAKAVVAPYAGPIEVVTPDGPGDGKPFYLTLNLGESPYDVIERIARYEGLLVYENESGNLVLSRVGKTKHASGVTEGLNVQGYSQTFQLDARFSEYIPLIMSNASLGRDGSSTGGAANAAGEVVFDTSIKRYRPRVIVSEQANADGGLAHQRAVWEYTRRIGRSVNIAVTVDSWLDKAGKPWTPNQLVPISLRKLKGETLEWIIVDVRYHRDGQSGTTAQLTLMPPEALTIQPSALNATSLRALPGQPGATPTPTPTGDGRRDRGPAEQPKPTAPNAAPPGDGRRDRGTNEPPPPNDPPPPPPAPPPAPAPVEQPYQPPAFGGT